MVAYTSTVLWLQWGISPWIGMLVGGWSFLPGGLGSREAVMSGLLMMYGFPESAAVTATTASTGTGGNTGGSLPKHAVTGYWQNFNNGAKVQKISDVPAAYDIIAVAFAARAWLGWRALEA